MCNTVNAFQTLSLICYSNDYPFFLIKGTQPITIKGSDFSQSWNPYTPLGSSSVEYLFLNYLLFFLVLVVNDVSKLTPLKKTWTFPPKLIIFLLRKDKRMIILHAVPISIWPMLGKENRYFHTRHSNSNSVKKIFSKHVFTSPNHKLFNYSLILDDKKYEGF